jgi:hypothetical protein
MYWQHSPISLNSAATFPSKKSSAAAPPHCSWPLPACGAFLGVQRGQADEFGVRVSNASAALIIEKTAGTAAKFAARTNVGTVSIPGLPDLDLSGPTALEINRLGRSITANIPDLSGVNIPLSFSTGDLVNRFGGNLDLDIDGFTRLTGAIAFEKQTDNGTTEIRVAGTGINTFLGRNDDGTVGNSDDVGVRITNARLGAVLYRTSAGATSFAVDAKGTATLVGVDGFTLTGDLSARINTTGGAVNETINMPSGSPVVLTFGATEAAAVFSGTVTAEVSQFATISGAFSVASSANRLTVAASGVTAFVGNGDLGVNVTAGNLGAVIKTDTKKFAVVASGDAALQGVSGLTVTGGGSVRINKLGETINETISTPGGPVEVNFTSATDILQVRGTLNLQFQSFVYASGDFLLEKTQVSDLTTITLAASNLNAFLGVNYGVAGEFGVKVTGGWRCDADRKTGQQCGEVCDQHNRWHSRPRWAFRRGPHWSSGPEHQQARPHDRHQHSGTQRRDLPAELHSAGHGSAVRWRH